MKFALCALNLMFLFCVSPNALFANHPLSSGVGFALDNGDVNGDLRRNLADVVGLVGHVFFNRPGPVPLALCGGEETAVTNGDTNGNGRIGLADAVRLARWIFSGKTEPVSACSQDGLPRIVPVDATPYGKTYGEWDAEWWRWAWSIPVAEHPLFDNGECDVANSSPVWFLGGQFASIETEGGALGIADRSCTVPAGTAIYYPLLNVICSPAVGDEPPLDACAQFFGQAATGPVVEIDGVAIQDLERFHVQSPVFEFSFPADNIFGASGPGSAEGADDGIYIMIAPLSPGEHELRSSGKLVFTEAEFGFDFTFELDITYHLTVVE